MADGRMLLKFFFPEIWRTSNYFDLQKIRIPFLSGVKSRFNELIGADLVHQLWSNLINLLNLECIWPSTAAFVGFGW